MRRLMEAFLCRCFLLLNPVPPTPPPGAVLYSNSHIQKYKLYALHCLLLKCVHKYSIFAYIQANLLCLLLTSDNTFKNFFYLLQSPSLSVSMYDNSNRRPCLIYIMCMKWCCTVGFTYMGRKRKNRKLRESRFIEKPFLFDVFTSIFTALNQGLDSVYYGKVP